ncbi:hypothetical protein EXIGLDRAFT_820616 [Exidia glandulosa HHB12029]|uniref:F-box domain-containing protein n=1 Tax=Exidia glandulosa HHB12029 TaxID=1314781 RepID=A0A165Z4N1_EXIGL|nr:hypothetical protein EXIGLDRAFT_820616 [Exidia glandulosa HHB12029]
MSFLSTSGAPMRAVYRPSCRIAALPVELLVNVFSQTRSPHKLMSLARVCRHWSSIVLSAPSLWTSITVSSHTKRQRLEAQIARSGAHPLSVKIVLSMLPNEYLDQLLATLLDAYLRVQSMHITVDEDGHEEEERLLLPEPIVSFLCRGRTWPSLRSFSVEYGDTWNWSASLLDIVAPQLVDINFSDVFVRDWTRMQLSVVLRSVYLEIDTTPATVLSALYACSNLEAFTLHNTMNTPDDLVNYCTPCPPLLPNLRHLDLHCAVIHTLSLFTLLSRSPRLTDISIHASDFEPAQFDHYELTIFWPNLQRISLRVNEAVPLLQPFLLALDATLLHHIEVIGSLLPQPLPSFGPALRVLKLNNVDCDTRELVQSLVECINLHTIVFSSVLVSPWDRAMVVPTFPSLRVAELDFSSIRILMDPLNFDDTLDLLVAMLPVPTLTDIDLSDVLLSDQHVSRVLADIQALELRIRVQRRQSTSVYVGIKPDTREARATAKSEARRFTVQSILSTMVLMETFGISSRISDMELDVMLLVQFLCGLPAQLPVLREMVVYIWDQPADSEVERVYDSILESFGERHFKCPLLRNIDVTQSSGERPGDCVPSDETVRRFVSIFESTGDIVLNHEDELIPPSGSSDGNSSSSHGDDRESDDEESD